MLPVIDPYVLGRLGVELGDHRAATRVAGRFLSLLDSRTLRMQRAIAARDTADALDCVLSLKVTSSMLGGRRLQDRAERLEAALRAGLWPETTAAMSALLEEVAPLAQQLQALRADLDLRAARQR